VDEVRVFTGRTSMGVRGITLDNGEKVISLSILRHLEVSSEERAAYLKRANAVRRGLDETVEEAVDADPDLDEASGAIELGEQRYVELSTAEQFVLTVSERGYGKRTSSYEYRTTGRGGKGIVAMDNRERDGSLRPRIGRLVASFPVEESDQLMLVTDGGQLIRVGVDEVGIKGRKTRGVIVFNTAEAERVVAVERLSEEGGEVNGE
jgi:DNA gyrase subunit A